MTVRFAEIFTRLSLVAVSAGDIDLTRTAFRTASAWEDGCLALIVFGNHKPAMLEFPSGYHVHFPRLRIRARARMSV